MSVKNLPILQLGELTIAGNNLLLKQVIVVLFEGVD